MISNYSFILKDSGRKIWLGTILSCVTCVPNVMYTNVHLDTSKVVQSLQPVVFHVGLILIPGFTYLYKTALYIRMEFLEKRYRS